MVEMETGSSLGCTGGGQKATSTRWKAGRSAWILGEVFSPQGVQGDSRLPVLGDMQTSIRRDSATHCSWIRAQQELDKVDAKTLTSL